ncbi:hypothetical protein MTX26_22950 [Bradyrhizobium sp. ISRA443]|uniref:hypothetical protein n=1 Tax=unclassified Bradyrhizobium TaxID=2631580 RepID=UPI002479631B|nr:MULTISPECIES: hypothetical protein [unclassified Bradyrhizobium]WGR92814.1 hypothetical protein MTX20_33785 [Bradyrhizobium sp. ISRA435]WGR97283.1 hypothetical protein MTX23_22950 [Bradyrhizobium sp. ISRA436]WGS04172.1 hypothetical protein MTX18_22950 [Bradyrhizobium sp. ISRA437]WGS11055.1 hypothetical protein MTX26_22950 [Bradyrhizobium sp. ISRA443]
MMTEPSFEPVLDVLPNNVALVSKDDRLHRSILLQATGNAVVADFGPQARISIRRSLISSRRRDSNRGDLVSDGFRYRVNRNTRGISITVEPRHGTAEGSSRFAITLPDTCVPTQRILGSAPVLDSVAAHLKSRLPVTALQHHLLILTIS